MRIRALLKVGGWVVALGLGLQASTMAQGQGMGQNFQILDVNGEEVRIQRDAFGVPQITAETNRGLFEAYGYVIAQDRLWQLELNRRAARGRLAEILGPGSLAADRNTRRLGYTDAELDQQFATLSSEEQEINAAYANGINRYLTEVVAPDPVHKLPFEFHHLQLGVPAPWSTRDIVAFATFQGRTSLESGDLERSAQTLLSNLVARHGAAGGLAIFNDVQWIHDPDSPASIPADGPIGNRPHPPHPSPPASQLQGAAEAPESDADVEAILEGAGVMTRFGSHAWAVGPHWSTNGRAMLFGGPQGAPTNAPTIVPPQAPAQMHEVELDGGNGFHVRGMALAGLPRVVIGRNTHVAWSHTTASNANNVDTYVETVCGGGTGYLYNGTCMPFETRTEVIKVKGAADDILTVERTVHGPVVASGPGVRFSRKSVQRNRETSGAFLGFNRARNLQEFAAAVQMLVGSLNVLYADKSGNIAYWRAGATPERPAGFDPRLPLPGDGSAEWTGELQSIPTCINPARGWLASWNNKATVDEESADPNIATGKQQRVLEIEDRLRSRPISLAEMLDIESDIARIGRDRGIGRLSRYLRPYLLQALDAVPSSHALAAQARAVVGSWDGNRYADAVTSTTRQPGEVIFSTWLDLMLPAAFGDELGADVGQATPNMLIHVLDAALGGGSGVPPSRDYFNGQDPKVVMSEVFTNALNSLGPDPTGWSTKPRDVVRFRHALVPVIPEVGSMFDSDRDTYAQVVAFTDPVYAQNTFPLGQSGFIGLGPGGAPVFDPHFSDLLPLYRNFEYKPMPITPNGMPATELGLDALELGSGSRLNFMIERISPNPSSGPARIEFATTREGPVRLSVYDIGGREIARLVDGKLPAGRHEATWRTPKVVRSGIYLVRCEAEGKSLVRRVVVAR